MKKKKNDKKVHCLSSISFHFISFHFTSFHLISFYSTSLLYHPFIPFDSSLFSSFPLLILFFFSFIFISLPLTIFLKFNYQSILISNFMFFSNRKDFRFLFFCLELKFLANFSLITSQTKCIYYKKIK